MFEVILHIQSENIAILSNVCLIEGVVIYETVLGFNRLMLYDFVTLWGVL